MLHLTWGEGAGEMLHNSYSYSMVLTSCTTKALEGAGLAYVYATVAHQGLSSDAERIVMFTPLAALMMCNSCNLVVAHFYAILN
jgi:hypothetical protein